MIVQGEKINEGFPELSLIDARSQIPTEDILELIPGGGCQLVTIGKFLTGQIGTVRASLKFAFCFVPIPAPGGLAGNFVSNVATDNIDDSMLDHFPEGEKIDVLGKIVGANESAVGSDKPDESENGNNPPDNLPVRSTNPRMDAPRVYYPILESDRRR
jgi:hypothetical protein